MKIKIFETIETIRELPDNYFDQFDYDLEDLSDDEIAGVFEEGKLLYENRQYCDGNDNEIISWSTNVWVYDEKTKQDKSVPIETTMGKEFKTTLETHDLPTRIEVIDQPSGIYNINYETFKEYFVEEGFETEEKWELYLQDFVGVDQDVIEEIAEFYDVYWAYCDPDGHRNKGNDYFVIYK